VIFVSDAKGTPADLTVEFELQVPIDQKGGTYSSGITYSMSLI
jgi:hypothetical protein